jgi:hypothetical protein
VALEIALGDGTDGQGHEYVIQMTYVESATVETPNAGPPAVEARVSEVASRTGRW